MEPERPLAERGVQASVPAKHSLAAQIPAFIIARIVLSTMLRMVYPFLPVFGRGLGVDLWLLSLGVTLRSGAGVLGPFLAWVADNHGRKAGMLVGLLVFSSGAALLAIWPGYLTFVLALILTLVGNIIFISSMQAYLGDRVQYERRGLALALTEFGWSFSFILGVPAAGLIIARWGWLAPFPVLAVLGLLGLGLLAWMLPAERVQKDHRAGMIKNLRSVFAYPPAIAGLMMGIAFSGANELVNLVLGVWMEDAFGLQIAALGAASAVLGISELGGESLVSVLTDRLGKERSVAAGLIFNTVAALSLPWLGVNLTGALVGLFLFYITFEFTVVSTVPLMTEVLPPARATLMATYIGALSLGRVFGDLLAPQLYAGWGMAAITLGAAGFNLIALMALRRTTPIREN